ncbi:MAG TPA: RecX family transcriptional regulator [Alphaproteobacteria bacterium]|nr:RecX family transcriptional regulator [Alphaproteobacteria bacterium]HJL57826.1 RecX family transcriptional regulator [Alphaproteobacteria bacterium]|tara:strand:+ start:553 stop:927 length:375 start_codon:yes stop_codon:yes gene_type:complete
MNLKKKDKFILYSSIASILSDLENNKLIDDKNFTQSKIHSLSLQGKSKISIISYFVQKGIEKNLIEESFENLELKNPNWEKESAKIFARKKRLGIKYSANFEKDLAKMARAGFSYNLSKKILES